MTDDPRARKLTDLEKRQRDKATAERRRERLKPKPIETLVCSGDLTVTYDPNKARVTIVYGLGEVTMPEIEAIAMRDALLDRLA